MFISFEREVKEEWLATLPLPLILQAFVNIVGNCSLKDRVGYPFLSRLRSVLCFVVA